jgi:type IV pilus assembly protein PilM
MFRRADILPIALDIGHDSVKMLQLELAGQRPIVRAAARRQLDPDLRARGELALDGALEQARDMLRTGGFVGRGVVAALPRDIVHIKNLRLPVMPPAELAAAIRYEARNIFPFDTESAYVDYLAVSEVRQGGDVRQEIIVLAAQQVDVDDFVEQLDRHGMIVESLDAEPCALYRTVEKFVRRRDDELEVHVLIDVGLRRTQVVIGRGREMSFFKPIDIGGQRLNDTVAHRLGITLAEAQTLRRRLAPGQGQEVSGQTADGSPAGQEPVRQAVFNATRAIMEDLAREVSLCLRYHSVTFRGPGPSRVRLLGGEANDTSLRAILSAGLSMPVEVGRPLVSLNCDAIKAADKTGPMCEWAAALGLAFKKSGGKFPPKDGRPRLTRGAIGEVIDLNQAVASPSASASTAPDGRAALVDTRIPAEVFRA